MPYPVVSNDPEVQACYEDCRAHGTEHTLAEMLALRSPPGAVTDREFFRGTSTLADQFKGQEQLLERMVNLTERRSGKRPNYTDVYVGEIADGIDDIEAFVPAGGGRSHIKRVCEKRNLDCGGLVKVKTGLTHSEGEARKTKRQAPKPAKAFPRIPLKEPLTNINRSKAGV